MTVQATTVTTAQATTVTTARTAATTDIRGILEIPGITDIRGIQARQTITTDFIQRHRHHAHTGLWSPASPASSAAACVQTMSSTAPMLTAVFGLPFGISINISIDNLRRDGYYIDGYNNNEVYLRNVYEMNYSWDDGVVIYDSSGRMQSARLYQSTYGYDSSRFDNLYSQICSQYGLPATQKYRNGEKTVTWYDRNGSHYVSLAYNHMTSDGGYPRYYTILCYGI